MDKFKIPAGTRLAHAYIAASMNEDVRNGLARTLAAAMLCEADGEERPCGRCAACRKSLKGLHPDITVITPGLDSKGRKKREITVDIVRALSSEEQVVPNEARRKAFDGYQINADLMKLAKPDAMVQHCLPAHRGEEITEDVFEAHADEIFEEAENRLHAQKAVLVTLMEDKN